MELTELLGNIFTGNVLAALGAAVGVGIAGLGSAKGLGTSGATASALTAEQEKNFSTILILEALPQTQAIYAFVIGILIITGIMAEGGLTVEKGLLSLAAGLCVGFTGLSAIYQGNAASSAVAAYGRNNNITGKVIIYVVMCELAALLGFITAIMILIAGNVF
jgi:V/A-type H+/Na+-transporting ATPase subunit K